MPSDLTPAFGNLILRWLNEDAAMPASPANLYLAIFNGNPKGSGTEIGASIKAAGPRQLITFSPLAAGASHLLTSNIACDWGLSENGPLTATHLALCDNATPGSGTIYASRQINGAPLTNAANAAVKFSAGGVTFNIGANS